MQIPVLVDRVPYDWEDLKKGQAPASELANLRKKVRENEVAAEVRTLLTALPDDIKTELVNMLIPVLIERINSQSEIIIDLTMKTTASRIRADIRQMIDTTVKASVRDLLSVGNGHA